MPSPESTQLFAILASAGDDNVRRLPLAQELQAIVHATFVQQASLLKGTDTELVDFHPSLRPDEDHLIRIANFQPPSAIRAALEAPLSVQTLTVNVTTLPTIRGLFVGEIKPRLSVRIQAFDKRQVLSRRGLSMILTGDVL